MLRVIRFVGAPVYRAKGRYAELLGHGASVGGAMEMDDIVTCTTGQQVTQQLCLKHGRQAWRGRATALLLMPG